MNIRVVVLLFALLCAPVVYAQESQNTPLCSVSSDPRSGVNAAPQSGALNIEEADTPGQVYSRSGTANKKPFSAIVMHYTESGTCNTNALVRSTKMSNPRCGGSPCGYHFLVGPDGRVVNVANLEKRTNHVKDQTGSGVNNTNAIGVSLVCGERGETQAAQQSTVRLVRALQQKYNIPNNRIFAHPEIQPDKDKNEAKQITAILRGGGGSAGGVSFTLPSGEIIWCRNEALSQQPTTFGGAFNQAVGQAASGDWRGALQTMQQQMQTPTITEINSPDSGTQPGTSGFSNGGNGASIWTPQQSTLLQNTTGQNGPPESMPNTDSEEPFDFTQEPGNPSTGEGLRFLDGNTEAQTASDNESVVNDTQATENTTPSYCPTQQAITEQIHALRAQRDALGGSSTWLGSFFGFAENSDAQRDRLNERIAEQERLLNACNSIFGF